MIIAIFVIIRILLIVALFGFIVLLLRTQSFKDSFGIVKRGFKTGLYYTGLFPSKDTKRIELYQWIPDKSIAVCEDSKRLADLPAMDLADWMAEGLPKSPDNENACEKDCRCQLVCVKKHIYQA